ncbi:MAG: CBS domain-containing protein [Nocardioidaceae bacterium]
MQILDVLRSKGNDVVTVTPQTPVRELVSLLADKNIGAVVVSTAEQLVAGIVSERDVVRKLASGAGVLDQTVGDIMTVDVVSVEPSESVHELARLMTERRIRHVPVVSDGVLSGIVSIGDVVKSRIDELTFERDQLESYVSKP